MFCGRCCLLSQIVFVGGPVRIYDERHHARRTIRRRICHYRERIRTLQQNLIVIPMKWFGTSAVRFHSGMRQVRPDWTPAPIIRALPVEAVVRVTRADELRRVRVGSCVIFLFRRPVIRQLPRNHACGAFGIGLRGQALFSSWTPSRFRKDITSVFFCGEFAHGAPD